MKILGFDYSIELVSSANMSELGTINHGSTHIRLRDNMSEVGLLSTLIHEIVHAVDFQLSLDMGEENVNRMATGLYQTMVDNGVNLRPLLKEKKHG